MATKVERIEATQMNLKMVQSKMKALKLRDKELSLKIERLNEERTALHNKYKNLMSQEQKLSTFLNQQKNQ